MKKTIIIEGITILYIILFLYTGISKIADYVIFKEQIALSPVLAPIAKPIAILLPITEFLVVLFLIIPRWRLKGLLMSAALMTIFTIYIIAVLLLSEEIPCSCGGIISELSWGQHIILNSIFIIMSIIAIVLTRNISRSESEQLSSALQH